MVPDEVPSLSDYMSFNGIAQPYLLNGDGHALQAGQEAHGLAIPPVSMYVARMGGASDTWWHDRFDQALKFAREYALNMRNSAQIQAMLEERKRAVCALKWHLETPDEKDPKQQEVRDSLTQLIRGIGNWPRMQWQWLDAIWFGKSGVQVSWMDAWVKGRKGITVAKWCPIMGDKIGHQYRDQQTREYVATPYVLIDPAHARSFQGKALIIPTSIGMALLLRGSWKQRVIIHKHYQEDSDYFRPEEGEALYGVGVRSKIFWLWWLRQEVLGNIVTFFERVGLGMTVWTYPQGDNAALQAVQQAATQQSNRVNLFVPVTYDANGHVQQAVQRLEPPVAGAEFLLKFVTQMFDSHIERYIVGQEASSRGSAGGLGNETAGAMQQGTKADIIRMDAAFFDSTVTGGLDEPGIVDQMQQAMFPETMPGKPNGFPVWYKTDVEAAQGKEKLEAAKTIFDMQVPIKEEEALGAAGFSKPTKTDDVVSKPDEQGVGGDPLAAAMSGAPMGQQAGSATRQGPPSQGADSGNVSNKDENVPNTENGTSQSPSMPSGDESLLEALKHERPGEPIRYWMDDEGIFHGPTPPNPSWKALPDGPRGGKRWGPPTRQQAQEKSPAEMRGHEKRPANPPTFPMAQEAYRQALGSLSTPLGVRQLLTHGAAYREAEEILEKVRPSDQVDLMHALRIPVPSWAARDAEESRDDSPPRASPFFGLLASHLRDAAILSSYGPRAPVPASGPVKTNDLAGLTALVRDFLKSRGLDAYSLAEAWGQPEEYCDKILSVLLDKAAPSVGIRGWQGVPIAFAMHALKVSQATAPNPEVGDGGNQLLPREMRPPLKPEQALALQAYTSIPSSLFDDPLKEDQRVPEDFAHLHDALHQAFAGTPILAQPVRVNQQLELKDADKDAFLGRLTACRKAGKPIRLGGYQLASTEQPEGTTPQSFNDTNDVRVSIDAVHALDMMPYSPTWTNREVLLDHDSRFQVVEMKQDEGTWMVHLRQLPPRVKQPVRPEPRVPVRHGRDTGGALQYSIQHAPAGGVTVGGTFYPGGEFIPDEAMAKATAEERQKIEGTGQPTPAVSRAAFAVVPSTEKDRGLYDLTLGGQEIGEMDIRADETRLARRMFPTLVKPGETVTRIHGVHIDEEHQGRGLGQMLYLGAFLQHGSSWYYNSQTYPPATNTLKALAKKGWMEVHWDRNREPGWNQPGGVHLVRPTLAGKQAYEEFIRSQNGGVQYSRSLWDVLRYDE